MSSAPITNSDVHQAAHGRLVTRLVTELQTHPALLRLGIPQCLFADEQLECLLQETVTVSKEGYVLGGEGRLQLALQQGETVLTCLELDLSSEEAVLWIIQKHQRSAGLNDFNRTLLALDLEPWFKIRAKENQRLGNRGGSSNLTEAEKLDVRKEVAAAARVSTGNVTKSKHLIAAAIPDVLESLRSGEISIHRASVWLKTPERQLDLLTLHRDQKVLMPRIKSLLNAHTRASSHLQRTLVPQLISALSRFTATDKEPILVAEVDVRGKVLFVSKGLLDALGLQAELNL